MLDRKFGRNIGTSFIGIGAAVAAGRKQVTLSLKLCNKSAGSISVDAVIRDSTTADTYFLFGFNVPAGETLVPEGANGKDVLLTGDQIFIKSNVAASLDVIYSFSEKVEA